MSVYRDKKEKGKFTGTAIKHTALYYVKRIIFDGFFTTALLLILQIILIVLVSLWIDQHAKLVFEGFTIFGFIAILAIVTGDKTPESRLAWSVIIAILPIAGVVLYILVSSDAGVKRVRTRLEQNISATVQYIGTKPDIKERIEEEHTDLIKLTRYMEDYGDCAVYDNSMCTYYTPVEEVVDPLIEALESATSYIFLEFFMIESDGIFWNKVLDVLKRKAAQGVEVRLLYDDLGCVAILPRRYYKTLIDMGIQVRVFGRVTPFLSLLYNNRDHRKIVVVDGRVAFSGGFNLCDEYINAIEKFGHWKDNAIRIEGEAVKQFTLMFLQMWNTASIGSSAKDGTEDYPSYISVQPAASDGLFIPYGDGPYRKEALAKYVYKDIINNAKDYVWIMTPYLIPDHGMETAIIHAAKSGIDVRILLPHIPDKKVPFMIARSYYPRLLKAGVKIYEYEPGFVHAKCCISDDRIGTVGTVNLDYRSLFLHYECGCLFYKCSELDRVKADFTATVDKCIEVDMAYYQKLRAPYRLSGRVFRVFGPLM